MVAPVKPPTQLKRVAAQGKATSHPLTPPNAHKVTWITSPMPEVAVMVSPPVSGPSCAKHPLLFEEPVMSGEEVIVMEAPATSGE